MFPVSRIVCLTEETVETLYLLGEKDRIVGILGYGLRPPQARCEKPQVSAVRPLTSTETRAQIESCLRRCYVLIFFDTNRLPNPAILGASRRARGFSSAQAR